LAAAGLAFVEKHFTAETPQNLDRAYADLRAKLINQTCYKQGDFHG